MSRQHFEALAEEIAKIDSKAARKKAAAAVIAACARFNPNFNTVRFWRVCNL